MNQLSILLYIADSVEKVGSISIAGMIISGFFILLTFIVPFLDITSQWNEQDKNTVRERYSKFIPKYRKLAFAGLFVSILLLVVAPSRQTVILIAASEFGETITKNQKVLSVVDPAVELLQVYIKKELANTKKQLENMTTKQGNDNGSN